MQGLFLPELVSTTQAMTMELHAFEIFPPFETDDEGHALSLFLSETRLTAVFGNGGASLVVTTADAERFTENRDEGARHLSRAIQLDSGRLLAVGNQQSLWLS
jgi:hypothetical protein